VWERRRRPLKLGIHTDILAVLDGAVTPRELSRALRRYVSNTYYLRMMAAGAARIDLGGRPAGVVTADEAATAAVRLTSYTVNRKRQTAATAVVTPAPPAPEIAPVLQMPPPQQPNRISLDDLRQAARLRRMQEAAQ
jgi:sRNA-binding protein